MTGMFDLTGRVAVVTGASRGIGEAIAKAYAQQGAKVVVSSRKLDGCAAVAEAINGAGGEAIAIACHIGDMEALNSLFAQVEQRFGRLDVLVNNAGLHRDHLLAAMPDEAWSSVISANLDSVFLGCRAVIRPMMAQRFGRIVNIASLSALLPPLGQTNYAAAKAGVVALTRTLAKEVARAGITVNAVLPGYIATEALAHMDEEAAKRAKAGIPMRRFGTPAEVAAAVRFLACHDAAYVTGSALKIDGGIF